MCDDASHIHPGGNDVEMTMLFADKRSSTELSERMSPRDSSTLVNQFYTRATRLIAEADGLVDKLAGDLVAAFWGAGFAGRDYLRRTVKVAQHLSGLMKRQGIPVSIGMHSGVAYFGVMGAADGLTDITAVGDEVKRAARLASKAAAGEIPVTEQALSQAGIDGSRLEKRSLELKGIEEPVSVPVMRSL